MLIVQKNAFQKFKLDNTTVFNFKHANNVNANNMQHHLMIATEKDWSFITFKQYIEYSI